jgi:hypothetical protein
MRFLTLLLFVLLAPVACGDREPDEASDDATASGDQVPGGAAGTSVSGQVASTAEAIGVPEPPGGYAVDSRPTDGAKLAKIEYASPNTVLETAEFYDEQMNAARRVQLEVGGDDIIVYGLSPESTVSAATTYTDVERLLDERTEPIVVISPWTMQRTDPLIQDLRGIGQAAQADALLSTKSKVTVVYALD